MSSQASLLPFDSRRVRFSVGPELRRFSPNLISSLRFGARLCLPALCLTLLPANVSLAAPAGDAAYGTRSYDDYEEPSACAECHADITRQHEQAMMSKCFVHEWDEIEYFELALPHAEKVAKVAGVKAGCNGCHAPLAFLAGDIPPGRPAAGSRANEGVSCDLCHSVTGFEGDIPFNFNWISEPGDAKQGPRPNRESDYHDIVYNEFLSTAEFCGTCHNEKDPWGLWVKATHLEWKEGPYAAAGVTCQNCHMAASEGVAAVDGELLPDVRNHLFNGAHDNGKLIGSVEVRIHSRDRELLSGGTAKLTAVVLNAKAGHMIPTGSAEERLVWLEVEAKDSAGHTWHLPVDLKGFDGEEFTVGSDVPAYFDLGEIQEIPNFQGLRRDGPVPVGDRIFRLPYFDPKGRMTVAQWNTAAFGTDYRLPPLQAKSETFTWALPSDLEPGEVEVTAKVYYSRLVSSVAEHMGVPAEEYAPVQIAGHRTTLRVM